MPGREKSRGADVWAERALARELGLALREQEWRNEQVLNLFRAVVWFGVGTAITVGTYLALGQLRTIGSVLAMGWGVACGLLGLLWLRRSYHRVVSFILTSMDVVLLAVTIDQGHGFLRVGHPDWAAHQIYGWWMAGLMLILLTNMLRFSWQISIWSVACGLVAYLVVLYHSGRLDSMAAVDALFLASIGPLLVYTTRKWKSVVSRVVVEVRRVQREKLESLSKLVAGVAHELNTPVGAIHSSADLAGRALRIIRDALSQDELAAVIEGDRKLKRALVSLEESTAVTQHASRRIATVVDSLSNFAGLDEADVKLVDLHERIRSTVSVLGIGPEKRIDVVVEPGDIPAIQCTPVQINQVLMSLLRNAVRAIDKEGTITIRTSVEDGYAVVEVSDTGRGIAPQDLPRIFEPGYSRWDVGVGTGLGLSTARSVMEQHDGSIDVHSEPTKGTTFTLRLPIEARW